MAKDGDIIETMLGWIFDLIGWIIGGIIKLFMALVVGLFNGIVALFKKGETNA